MMSKLLQNYLRFWARLYLRRVKPKIIAVTGSAGKTSTKDAIFEVLYAGFGDVVRKSEGNLNTIYGVSLAILGYKKPPVPLDRPFSPWPWIPILFSVPLRIWTNPNSKYLVLEIAADKPGDIKFITSFVKPSISVITNIGPAHLEIFGSFEKIVEEKIQLLNVSTDENMAVLNIDDATLSKIAENGNGKIKTFSLQKKADVTAKNITTEIVDYSPLTKFQIISEKAKFQAQTHTLGREANIYPALVATAVGEILSLKTNAIIEGLKKVKSEKHRMEVFQGINNAILIDDTYNANPLSVKTALNTLKVLPAKRKIAVLGDMLELGNITPKAHKLIGEYAHQVADQILAFGEKSKDYQADKNFPSKEELANYLLSNIRENDILLIKASRGMQFETVVYALKK